MNITPQMTNEAVLQELGARLAGARLERNLTQAALAEQAGVSKRMVERLESGEVAAFAAFISVCRALGLLERFDALISEPKHGPIQQLKLKGRQRKRASDTKPASPPAKKWTWGDQA